VADVRSSISLSSGEVDVWAVRLESSEHGAGALVATLSTDEQQRADRFHFDRDRWRFICGRGVLRQLLGTYLNVSPVDITFGYGTYGKPALSGRGEGLLKFNVSHSHELALVAVGDVEMGVDVEAIRPMADADEIASRFFSSREVADLRALPLTLRDAAFFACWTRKEAYLKALGSGLARPLDGFTVTLAPATPIELVVHGDARETARWSIRELSPPAGYAAALVTEGCPTQVRSWQWPPMR
jgi:4'-phosphopantetheinyl transferase